jgi:hypothetical protein
MQHHMQRHKVHIHVCSRGHGELALSIGPDSGSERMKMRRNPNDEGLTINHPTVNKERL